MPAPTCFAPSRPAPYRLRPRSSVRLLWRPPSAAWCTRQSGWRASASSPPGSCADGTGWWPGRRTMPVSGKAPTGPARPLSPACTCATWHRARHMQGVPPPPAGDHAHLADGHALTSALAPGHPRPRPRSPHPPNPPSPSHPPPRRRAAHPAGPPGARAAAGQAGAVRRAGQRAAHAGAPRPHRPAVQRRRSRGAGERPARSGWGHAAQRRRVWGGPLAEPDGREDQLLGWRLLVVHQ